MPTSKPNEPTNDEPLDLQAAKEFVDEVEAEAWTLPPELLETWQRKHVQEKDIVGRIGQVIGYGNLMQLASECWGEASHGGEFRVGPCAALTVPCGCDRRDCDWCCGCG